MLYALLAKRKRSAHVASLADGGFAEWIRERKNRRAIPHRLENCDYILVRNEPAKDGLWKINGKRQVVYANSALPDQGGQQTRNRGLGEAQARMDHTPITRIHPGLWP